jgi:hypothetical protein
MPLVKMPDGTVVNMPDNPTPQDLAAFKKLSAAPAETPWYQGAVDTAKNIGTGLYKGIAALPAAAADVFASQPDMADAISQAAGAKPRPLSKDLGVVSAKLEAAPGYTPKTTGERYTQAAARGVGGALSLPIGGLSTAALSGAGSGLGSEAAASAFGDRMLPRMLGGLAGGLAGGGLANLRTNKGVMAREALEGVSPEDLAKAQANMREAQVAGIPVNLAQAMERPSNIDKVAEALAASRHGTKVQAQLRAQPMQANMGLETEMAGLPGTMRTPQVAANNMQNVATAAVDKARQARTAAWEQKRAATEAATFGAGKAPAVTPQTVEAVAYKLGLEAEARPNTAVAEQLATLRSKLFDVDGNALTDPKQLNEILKEAATKLKSPDLATKGIDAGQSKFLSNTINEIREDLGPAFKPIREANLTYKQITDDVINPLKKSVVGRMAGRRGEVADAEAVRGKISQLFDQGTVPGAKASDILKLEKELRGIRSGEAGAALAGSEAFQDAAKSWIGERISEAVKPVGGRLNEDIAKRLVTTFAGNENKTQGFRDVMVGMARSQGLPDNALYPGMEKFIKVLGMASRRPAGAAGAGAGELEQIAGQSAFGSVGRFSAITPLRQPILKWMEFLKADAYKAMDSLLTTPEGVDMLKKLAKGSPADPKVQTAMATYLGTQANLPEGQPQQ